MGLRENLKQLMDSQNENPHSLSSKTGVTQPTIHRILDGTSKDPRRATLEPLAKYFGVTVDVLCGEKPKEAAQRITTEQQKILTLLDSLDKDARDSWIRIGNQLLRIPHQSPKKPREDQGVTDEQGLVKSAAKKIRVPGYSGHDRRKANAGHSPERRLDSNTYSDEHDLLDYANNDNREEQIQKRGEIDD